MKEKISKLQNHVIICGGGRIAHAVAVELEKYSIPFVIIEKSPDKANAKKEKKWLILEGDALDEATLQQANIATARGLASVLPTDADNLFVVLSARQLNPKIYIETRISQESSHSKMLQAGADKVIFPYAVAGLQIARGYIDPQVSSVLEVMVGETNYEFDLKTIQIENNDDLAGKAIHETGFREKGFMIIGVRFANGKMQPVPPADFLLEAGQQLFLIGSGHEQPLTEL